ncbi:MAG: hypothetical protein Q9P44_01580 [Anaerolineae bacterium]|nr:hypothetical protein [Anaerolineae bacterium]
MLKDIWQKLISTMNGAIFSVVYGASVAICRMPSSFRREVIAFSSLVVSLNDLWGDFNELRYTEQRIYHCSEATL